MLERLKRNWRLSMLVAAGVLAVLIGTLWAGTTEAAQLANQTDALSAEEQAALAFMREEEKLARDLYLAFYDLYGTPAFNNVASAEQRHMEAVLGLLERYGLTDPVADNSRGVFDDPELATLYEQLLAEGSASLNEALRVAAAVEEIDILDLQESLDQTDKLDIIQVYQNLLAGSVNHLRAYSSLWEGQTGAGYAPQYMDAGAYESMMEEAANPGQRGPGATRGAGDR